LDLFFGEVTYWNHLPVFQGFSFRYYFFTRPIRFTILLGNPDKESGFGACPVLHTGVKSDADLCEESLRPENDIQWNRVLYAHPVKHRKAQESPINISKHEAFLYFPGLQEVILE
jgi:hypothetical protein